MFVVCGRSSAGLFSVDWLADGSVALCAANGRYITARMNGSLNAIADGVTSDRERFHVTIINRAQLVLRCEYGFVGFRSDAHPRIECNKTTYDVISVEHSGGENAEYMYFLKGVICRSIKTMVNVYFLAEAKRRGWPLAGAAHSTSQGEARR